MGLLTVSQHCLDLSSGSEPHSFRREDRLKVCGFFISRDWKVLLGVC